MVTDPIELQVFVQYPGYVECGLKCPYCFHKEAWDLEKEGKKNTKYKDQIPFTFEDYQRWRDKFLPDATKFLMEIHSGEISYGKNKEHCLSLIDKADKETFQLQTNGMGSSNFYEELIKRKEKIDRIGFTFHRKVILENKNKDKLAERFAQNVFLVAKSGIKVIVKELLIISLKNDIMRSK
jgi:pyruvate-formate lyase-activating enzyme